MSLHPETLTCNILEVHDISAARSRAGSLAVLHLIPLLFVPNLNLAAEINGFFALKIETKAFDLSDVEYIRLYSRRKFIPKDKVDHVKQATRKPAFTITFPQ